MVIIDTIFIKRSHRRYGYARAFIQQLLNSPCVLMPYNTLEKYNIREHLLGFSSPISTGMLCLLIRMLVTDGRQNEGKSNDNIPWTDRLWLIIGDGSNGELQNVWWSTPKLARERRLDLKRLVSEN